MLFGWRKSNEKNYSLEYSVSSKDEKKCSRNEHFGQSFDSSWSFFSFLFFAHFLIKNQKFEFRFENRIFIVRSLVFACTFFDCRYACSLCSWHLFFPLDAERFFFSTFTQTKWQILLWQMVTIWMLSVRRKEMANDKKFFKFSEEKNMFSYSLPTQSSFSCDPIKFFQSKSWMGQKIWDRNSNQDMTIFSCIYWHKLVICGHPNNLMLLLLCYCSKLHPTEMIKAMKKKNEKKRPRDSRQISYHDCANEGICHFWNP